MMIAFFIFLCSFSIQAAEPDSTMRRKPKLDLESLSPDSFAVESDFLNMSIGWFPKIGAFRAIDFTGSSSSFWNDGVFHMSSDIPGSIFNVPNLIFSGNSVYSIDDRIPLLPFSMEESDEELHEQDFSTTYLRLRQSIPQLGIIMRIGLGITFVNRMFFAQDRSKQFLNMQGSLSELHELHEVSIDETELISHLSFELPIYGASMELFGQNSYSYYSFFAGINSMYVLDSDFLHQSFIVKGQDAIRYPSGSNVLTIQQRSYMNEIQRLRLGIETGLGWQFGFDPFHLGIEGFLIYPLNSILKNHDLQTLNLSLRTYLGFSF